MKEHSITKIHHGKDTFAKEAEDCLQITFDKEETEKYEAFCKKHKACCSSSGAIGGGISIGLMNTALGWIKTLECKHCGAKENITDYGNW